MSTANLKQNEIVLDDGLDSIVIVKCLGDIPGGRSLDVSEWSDEVVKSGHILVQNDTTKVIRPLGVTNNAYATLPPGHSYLGVLKCSISKKDPRASILTIGQVNASASPYPVTKEIKTGLPNIQFIY